MSKADPESWQVAQLSTPDSVVMITAWATVEIESWHAVQAAAIGGWKLSSLVRTWQ
jgi:hypothetical protein